MTDTPTTPAGQLQADISHLLCSCDDVAEIGHYSGCAVRNADAVFASIAVYIRATKPEKREPLIPGRHTITDAMNSADNNYEAALLAGLESNNG